MKTRKKPENEFTKSLDMMEATGTVETSPEDGSESAPTAKVTVAKKKATKEEFDAGAVITVGAKLGNGHNGWWMVQTEVSLREPYRGPDTARKLEETVRAYVLAYNQKLTAAFLEERRNKTQG